MQCKVFYFGAKYCSKQEAQTKELHLTLTYVVHTVVFNF
jgi:hypothetical protein